MRPLSAENVGFWNFRGENTLNDGGTKACQDPASFAVIIFNHVILTNPTTQKRPELCRNMIFRRASQPGVQGCQRGAAGLFPGPPQVGREHRHRLRRARGLEPGRFLKPMPHGDPAGGFFAETLVFLVRLSLLLLLVLLILSTKVFQNAPSVRDSLS